MGKSKRLILAEALAAYAHDGQLDRAGQPYINHPLTVASKVSSEDAKIVAMLHDTVEDTEITLATISNLFGEEISDAVAALTHHDDESYFTYVARAGQNSLAKQVKLADLEHNMDLSRLPTVTEKDLKRVEKYQKAKELLLNM